MQQEVVRAMLAKEPSHGYELRARLSQALGPLAERMGLAEGVWQRRWPGAGSGRGRPRRQSRRDPRGHGSERLRQIDLLHVLGGLDRPTSGELTVAGQRVDQLSERALADLRLAEVGFVFQALLAEAGSRQRHGPA